MKQVAIVIGANGGIGKAVVNQFLSENFDKVIAISRNGSSILDDSVDSIKCDPNIDDISKVAMDLCERLQLRDYVVTKFVIALGVLHTSEIYPEKRLEQLSQDSFAEVLRVNAYLPLAWLKAFTALLVRQQACKVAVLSARVGSISDNRLGGWYSYRASKACLNMLLKTLSVEYKRRAKGVKLIAFHPGTTNTKLSEPFQANVPEGKLFEPSLVAEKLSAVMDAAGFDGELSFLDWKGDEISW